MDSESKDSLALLFLMALSLVAIKRLLDYWGFDNNFLTWHFLVASIAWVTIRVLGTFGGSQLVSDLASIQWFIIAMALVDYLSFGYINQSYWIHGATVLELAAFIRHWHNGRKRRSGYKLHNTHMDTLGSAN